MRVSRVASVARWCRLVRSWDHVLSRCHCNAQASLLRHKSRGAARAYVDVAADERGGLARNQLGDAGEHPQLRNQGRRGDRGEGSRVPVKSSARRRGKRASGRGSAQKGEFPAATCGFRDARPAFCCLAEEREAPPLFCGPREANVRCAGDVRGPLMQSLSNSGANAPITTFSKRKLSSETEGASGHGGVVQKSPGQDI